MIKKRWTIFIALVLAITLSACTGNSPNNNSNDQISKRDNANTDTTTNLVYEDIKLTPGEVFNI